MVLYIVINKNEYGEIKNDYSDALVLSKSPKLFNSIKMAESYVRNRENYIIKILDTDSLDTI